MDSLIQEAKELYKQGNKKGALDKFNEALDKNNCNSYAWYGLAVCFESPIQKELCVKKSLEMDPSNKPAQELLEKLSTRPKKENTLLYKKMPIKDWDGHWNFNDAFLEINPDFIIVHGEEDDSKNWRVNLSDFPSVFYSEKTKRISVETSNQKFFIEDKYIESTEKIWTDFMDLTKIMNEIIFKRNKITPCRICGKDVSRTAIMCPNCGEGNPGLKIKCPKCGSYRIDIQKRGYSLGNATAGALMLGAVGLLGGLVGKDDIMFMCMNCNNRWVPSDNDLR